MSENDLDLMSIWADGAKKERPERESWAHKNMKEIARLTNEMREDGWKEISYCPKDGTMFLAWEPNCPLPYKCSYYGEWPKGSWNGYMDGDIWPVRPSLFRDINYKPKQKDPERDKLFKEYIELVFPLIDELKQNPRGSSGAVDCPKCGAKLAWCIASSNGHLHAQCATKDCINVME